MVYLIGEMIISLMVAVGIGFIFGWFIRKKIEKNEKKNATVKSEKLIEKVKSSYGSETLKRQFEEKIGILQRLIEEKKQTISHLKRELEKKNSEPEPLRLIPSPIPEENEENETPLEGPVILDMKPTRFDMNRIHRLMVAVKAWERQYTHKNSVDIKPLATIKHSPNYPVEKKVGLKAVEGMGPVLEKLLSRMGISTYQTLSRLSSKEIDEVMARLKGFPDRMIIEYWVAEARKLHFTIRKKYAETPLKTRSRP